MQASDIIWNGPANRPDDDVSTAGGAIDLTARPLDAQLAATADLEVLSDNAADTMNFTADRRLAGGSEQSDVVALNGTTPVPIPNGQAERLLLASLASAAAGTVTLRVAGGGATVHTFAPGELVAYMLFRKSEASAGQAEAFYEWVYARNSHGSHDLLTALAQLLSDPPDLYMQAVALAQGDVATHTNRKTAPGGLTFVDQTVDQTIPGTNLGFGARVGVCIRQDLGANELPAKHDIQTQLAGNSSA